MKLNTKNFIIYKLLNSLFTGLSIGILIIIYQPLEPIIYSTGGLFLAIAMLIIAKFYEKLLNIKKFFLISLFVEIIMLFTILIFFILKYSLTSALLIYSSYQITFIFGGYLVRAETLVVKKKKLLAKIDISKQVGYLIGLILSFIYYKISENVFNIIDTKEQINSLHYILLVLQLTITFTFIKSFNNN